MIFRNPDLLWFLVFVPVILWYGFRVRPSDLPSLRFSSLDRLPDNRWNVPRGTGAPLLGALRAIGVTLLVVALARPQRGLKSEELNAKAADILLCLDASRSMLAIDFKPENRFAVAKQVLADFVKGREYDRIGLVVFAEHAITQCPLTTDRNALLGILDEISVGVIPPDQTAIGVGVATAINRLKNSQSKSRVIILVTDGSNNAGSVDPLTAAKTAKALGIKVYTIGAGTPEGGLVPVDDPVMGRNFVPIRADLDEETLRKMADQTGGRYFRAKTEGSLKSILTEIDQLEKTDIKIREYVDYEELYRWFLVAAAAFLFLELGAAKTVYRTLP